MRSPWSAVVLCLLAGGGLLAGSGYALSGQTVAGAAVDVHGRPLAGVRAAVVGAGATPVTVTGASGDFRIRAGSRVSPAEVELSAPGYLSVRGRGGRVVLHRRPLVQGRAVDEHGDGVAYARLEVELTGGATVETMADGDGFFSLQEALGPGMALVTLRAPGHLAYQERTDLRPDAVDQVAALMPREVGLVDVSTDPAGVPVNLDGAPLAGCERTPCTVAVPAGNHVLSVDDRLFVPWSAPIALYQGAHLHLAAALTRRTGTMNLHAPGGADARLTVDGAPVAATGGALVLPTGSHTVVFTSAGSWPWRQTVDVGWNQTVAVNVLPAAVDTSSEHAFVAGMTAYLDSLPGHYGVYLSELSGGHVIGYHAGDSMEAASVIKLPLAIYVEQQAQSNALKMSDQVQLESGDFMAGTGTLQGTNSPGDSISYHDLLALLVQQSDNTAWKALDRVLGNDKVDAFTASIGGPDCKQEDDQCSAQESGQMLARLASGSLLDQDHTHELLGLLESTAFNDRINYYLPGTTIAHKVGMDGGVINDTGVVYAPKPLVVSVFTAGDDPDLGVEIIRLIALAAAKIYG